MRIKRTQKIFKLVKSKNEAVLNTLKKYHGKKKVEKMSGVGIYRNAKRLWNNLNEKEKLEWSKQ
jgi:hypothetical protein